MSLTSLSEGEQQEVESKFLTHQQIEEQQRQLQQQQQQQQLQTIPGLQHDAQLQQQGVGDGGESGVGGGVIDGVAASSSEELPVVKVQTDAELGDNVKIQYDEKGQKSYKCEICDKVLQSKYNLKRHNVSARDIRGGCGRPTINNTGE